MTGGYTHLLCGLSGSGKSTLGKMAAEKMGLDFVDFADVIVREAKALGFSITTHDDILVMRRDMLVRSIDNARKWCEVEVVSGKSFVLETHLGTFVEEIGYRMTSPEILRARNTLSITVILPERDTLEKYKLIRSAPRDSRSSADNYEMNKFVLLADAAVSAATLGVPLIIDLNVYGQLNATIKRLSTMMANAVVAFQS